MKHLLNVPVGTVLLCAAVVVAGTISGSAAFAATTPEAKPPPSPGEIVATAKADEWVAIPASDLLVMDLVPDARGRARTVIIQLAPAPLSQGWVDNIRTLAAAGWYDGTSVNRVQDNYVVQWGDAGGEDPKTAKPLPAGLKVMTKADYDVASKALTDASISTGTKVDLLGDAIGYYRGFPVISRSVPFKKTTPATAQMRADRFGHGRSWMPHCYGMVGVGRGMDPDTGSGAELYTVIGHSPRHLDRNIAVVGRVIEGIEHLSSLPRGTGGLGFYETAEERVPIRSIRLASALPADAQPKFAYLRFGTTFSQYISARQNRRDPFFIRPAGGADICNIPVPVRRVRAKQ